MTKREYGKTRVMYINLEDTFKMQKMKMTQGKNMGLEEEVKFHGL